MLKLKTHRIFVLGLSALMLINVATLTPRVSAQELKPQIVASSMIIEDFLSEIGGDLVDITAVLVEGTVDPHTYEPSQSDISALVAADAFFLFGRESLEPWWGGQTGYEGVVLADNPDLTVVPIMNASMTSVDPLLGVENPHSWMSPAIVKQMATNIYAALDPLVSESDQSQLQTNYNAFIAELDVLLGEIQGNRSTFEGLKVVVHHPSLMYLLDLLGIERLAVIEEQHDVEPSPQHIQEIRDLMLQENCSIIVSQTNLEENTVLQLARDTNASIVWGVPLLGMTGADGEPIETYAQMIRYNLWALGNPEAPPASSTFIPGFTPVALASSAILALVGCIILFNKRRNLWP